ncbi:YopX family protein [Enterococcus casseliflavus]|uniref:YopX family protein n=1 Tax=Enterococcus casseliflavus TaxID=37734 RepID=UPI00115AADAE|nr:YopX family protein [Enterococcus casseliflavus]
MIPKFRAWEPDTKFMNDQVRVTSNRFGDGEFLVEATDGFGWIEVKPEYLMQSTGLKDKNGVEIFEGDCFVKSFQMIEIPTGRTFLKDEIGVVKFIDGQFVCHIDGWGSEPLKDVLGYQNTNDDHWKDGLVIGNIWENPELLEQANEN